MQIRIKRNNHILLFILLGWIAIYSVSIIPMMHNVARSFSAWVNVGLLLVLPEYLTVFSAYISFLHKRKNRIILATMFAIISLLCTVWTSPLSESFLYGETLTIIELLFAILHIIPSVVLIVFSLQNSKSNSYWYIVGIFATVFFIAYGICIERLFIRAVCGLLHGLLYVCGLITFMPKEQLQKLSYLEQYKKEHNL